MESRVVFDVLCIVYQKQPYFSSKTTLHSIERASHQLTLMDLASLSVVCIVFDRIQDYAQRVFVLDMGVATSSRLLKIIGLFCGISSLL